MRAASEARSRSARCASSRTLASCSSRSSSWAAAALVLGVEPLLARVEAGDPGLECGEVALGASRAAERVLVGLGEAAELVVSGSGARAQRVDLADQPGQPLAAVGGGAVLAGDPALLLGDGVLGGAPRGDRLLEGDAVRLDLGLDGALLLAHLCGLGLQRLRVAAGGDVAGAEPLGVADPLRGERLGAAQPLAQPGQGEPGLLRLGQRRQVFAQRGLEVALVLGRLGPLTLDLLAARDQDGLVGELLLERGAGRHQVVGDQAGLGVADRGLDADRPPGDLGLAAQRLELAADLAEQVGEAGQVAVAGVELAERLLLALAVLEDAGGLLDEAAPVLRRRVQDRVELALADDDVHLAADAGVGEQLLDVEQSARRPVDGVLGATAAEHGPAERDLGVLDRQRAVGVVDGQQDLGPAQRRPARRTGEDDVLHLAAAQRLGALLAHDPGEGVDDVGLAGAVGPDDAGDPRLQLERGRGSEGLEPFEGQALQVHGAPSQNDGYGRADAGEAQRRQPYLRGTPGP